MRCVLLLNNAEPKPGEVSPEALAAMQEAFGAYGRELEEAGVLVAAEVLTSPSEGTSLTRRTCGELLPGRYRFSSRLIRARNGATNAWFSRPCTAARYAASASAT